MSSLSTFTRVWKYYYLYFTELSYFLKRKDMLEACYGWTENQSFQRCWQGKTLKCHYFYKLMCILWVLLKEGDFQKDIFKNFPERCSYFRSVAYSKLFSARFSEWSILGTCSILYHLYITTVLLLPRQRNLTFEKLIKINSTARYCETTTHWLPKYRNMLQYSISTASW